MFTYLYYKQAIIKKSRQNRATNDVFRELMPNLLSGLHDGDWAMTLPPDRSVLKQLLSTQHSVSFAVVSNLQRERIAMLTRAADGMITTEGDREHLHDCSSACDRHVSRTSFAAPHCSCADAHVSADEADVSSAIASPFTRRMAATARRWAGRTTCSCASRGSTEGT